MTIASTSTVPLTADALVIRSLAHEAAALRREVDDLLVGNEVLREAVAVAAGMLYAQRREVAIAWQRTNGLIEELRELRGNPSRRRVA